MNYFVFGKNVFYFGSSVVVIMVMGVSS